MFDCVWSRSEFEMLLNQEEWKHDEDAVSVRGHLPPFPRREFVVPHPQIHLKIAWWTMKPGCIYEWWLWLEGREEKSGTRRGQLAQSCDMSRVHPGLSRHSLTFTSFIYQSISLTINSTVLYFNYRVARIWCRVEPNNSEYSTLWARTQISRREYILAYSVLPTANELEGNTSLT